MVLHDGIDSTAWTHTHTYAVKLLPEVLFRSIFMEKKKALFNVFSPRQIGV